MRRFSQRNSLVTLSEINITPLLDLAFVLLIIFVITRPLLEQHLDLQLPKNMGARDAPRIDARDVRRVEINARGEYWLQGRPRPLTLPQMESELLAAHRQNPKLIVYIASDRRAPWEYGVAIINVCSRNGINMSVKTAPPENP